jgi:putative FmdB family regulatory protein
MPVYVYRCDTCGLTFERRQSMTEPTLVDCPECEGHVHRVIQPVGVMFKGSGFYVTDNRSPSATALPGKKEAEASKDKDSGASGGGSDTAANATPAAPKADTE